MPSTSMVTATPSVSTSPIAVVAAAMAPAVPIRMMILNHQHRRGDVPVPVTEF